MSSIIDYTDRTTCVMFGDGAGAASSRRATTKTSASSISRTTSTAAAGRPCACRPAAAGSRRLMDTVAKRMHYVKQDGQAVFKFAVRNTEEACRRILDRNGIKPDDIDLLVSHQANRRIILSAAEKLGVPEEKVVINIERFGNTTAATIPLALNDAVADKRLKRGDLLLMVSVGAALRSGSLLLRWGLQGVNPNPKSQTHVARWGVGSEVSSHSPSAVDARPGAAARVAATRCADAGFGAAGSRHLVPLRARSDPRPDSGPGRPRFAAVHPGNLLAGAGPGVPRVVQLRMIFNVAIDVLTGFVPLIGDLFDFAWKANNRTWRCSSVMRHEEPAVRGRLGVCRGVHGAARGDRGGAVSPSWLGVQS